MISFSSKGDWSDTTKWLQQMKDLKLINILEEYARLGVDALSAATPVDTGKTAASWEYEIRKSGDGYKIYWTNSNLNNGVPIALLIQYGHVTKSGFRIPGYDYINPVLEQIYDELNNRITEEVRR